MKATFSTKIDSAIQPHIVGEMITSFCWELTWDGLGSHLGVVYWSGIPKMQVTTISKAAAVGKRVYDRKL